jgi:hypothetical protein
MSGDIFVWLEVLWILAAISFMIRDNPVYRIMESLIVGALIGHGINTGINSLNAQILVPLGTGDMVAILGLIIGALVYVRYFMPSLGWLGRYPTAIMYGLGAGIALTSIIKGTIVGIILSIITLPIGLEWFMSTLIFASMILYFIFVMKHEGWYAAVAKVGAIFIFFNIGYQQGIFIFKSQPGAIERLGFIFRNALGVI